MQANKTRVPKTGRCGEYTPRTARRQWLAQVTVIAGAIGALAGDAPARRAGDPLATQVA